MSLEFLTDDGPKPYAPPQTDEQLQYWADKFLGVHLPDTAVCEGHVSPLKAVADAYFGRHPMTIWKASRGYGGKSTALGALIELEFLAGYDVAILGGSARQSQRVHELMGMAWDRTFEISPDQFVEGPFRALLDKEPTQWLTRGIYGNTVFCAAASQTSVRGPHPQRLRIDEVDEVPIPIMDAALGMPMSLKNPAHKERPDFLSSQVVLSSTHQYPDGTMSEVLSRARERGYPVYEWCYKETSEENGGWLTLDVINEGKERMARHMWETEVELQEPQPEGRVFDMESMILMFNDEWGERRDKEGLRYVIERPRREGMYSTGTDWGKDSDYTVISTIRYDVLPHRLVCWERVRRQSYRIMCEKANQRLREYPGLHAHDRKGVGTVTEDFLDHKAIGFRADGIKRDILLSDYILACEHGNIMLPKLETLFNDHKYLTQDQISGRGHCPDSVFSLALAELASSGKAAKLEGQVGSTILPIR